jgi:hypothetical protein
MSLTPAFAGNYSALEYWFGGPMPYCPPAIEILQGNTATGAGTIIVSANFTVTQASTVFSPFVVGQSIQVGLGSALETVTITSVGAASLVGSNPSAYSITIGATFAQVHGYGDPVSSVTFGLQEAINICNGNGGGIVTVTPTWFTNGGTSAIIQAAVVPVATVTSTGATGIVRIVDLQDLTTWTYSPKSVTVVSAPVAATSGTVASLVGVTGTWTAITIHVLFTYVTADGGESLASPDFSFTATVNLAIGGTGPAAATNAVGFRVYMGTNATTACYLSPVTAANGTPIQCGPIAAFKIGTSFSVATANVAAALPPLVQSTSFPIGFQPVTGVSLQQAFSAMQGPFAATSTVTAGTAIEWAKVQLPTGYLNFIGRTLRLTITGNYTPVSTATVIITVAIGSVYTGTETTIYTVTTPASSGTTNSVIETTLLFRVSVVGTTGKVRCHGFNIIGLATGTAGLGAASLDGTTADSSTVDLTQQDYIRVTINSGTANLTTSQCDMFLVETLA